MCTAVSAFEGYYLFGRTLDWMESFGEKIIITPRNCPLKFREGGEMSKHYAVIGMGIEKSNYPLYFDAFNEKGLCMAGLNFPKYAVYESRAETEYKIASFELIPWILGQCPSVDAAERILKNIAVIDAAFDSELPPSPLHWIISDKTRSITVEPLQGGVKIFDNSLGVLTNSPPFDYQMTNLSNYYALGNGERPSGFYNEKPCSFGSGALGLPGDMSSVSRFVRTAFNKITAESCFKREESITRFFHILESVTQIKGCVRVDSKNEYSLYTSCCDTASGVYHYKTYDNATVQSVALTDFSLDGTQLIF